MQVYPNPMLGSEKSARMVNSAGEEFFNQQQDDPLAFGPYTVQLKALAKQVHAGKARYDGGYYAGFDHCDAGGGRGLHDLRQDLSPARPGFPEQLVETAVTAHYRQGGIDVDTATMRSSVPGLYVAGGSGGHSNGLIALATYDGKVVAEGVARRSCPRSRRAPLPQAEIETESSGSKRLRHPRTTAQPPGEEEAPRAHVGKGRCREKRGGMRSALDEIERIRLDLLPGMRIRTQANRELRMARCHRRRQHDRCVRTHHPFLARAQGKPGAVHAPRFSADRQRQLAGRQFMFKTDNGFRFERRPYELPFFQPDFAPKIIWRWHGELPRPAPAGRCAAARPGRAWRHARRAQFAPRRGELSRRVRRSGEAAAELYQDFRCPTRNGCACSMLSTGSPRTQATDLAYRWFCGSKMCGTCAVRMNGREVLACWEAVEPVMTIEPLRNLPVIRDLVVDRRRYERQGREPGAVARAQRALSAVSGAA